MPEEQKTPTPPAFFLILGLFLVFLFGSGLFAMEKHFTKQKSVLSAVKQLAVTMPSVSSIDSAFNGKIIQAQGMATTTQTLQDARFGIDVKALGLVYEVEYYQDIDTGEGFEKAWTNRPAKFLNPQDYAINSRVMPELENSTTYVTAAKLGVYNISPALLQALHDAKPLELRILPSQLEALHTHILEAGKKALSTPDSVELYLRALQRGDTPRLLAKIVDNSLYLGFDPSNPELGDMRLSFAIVPEQEVSIVAQVEGDTFYAYKDGHDDIFPLIYGGKINTEEVISLRTSEDKGDIWLLRTLFTLLIIFGARMIISYYRRSAVEKAQPNMLSSINPWGPSLALGIVLTIIISFSGQLFA